MTVWTPTDDGHADLTSHDAFVDGPPHNTFARLRSDDPVSWTDYADGQGFWSITRYGDIVEMNRNFKVFSSAHGIRMEDQTHAEYLARRTFQETDPPEHMKVRIKVARAFSKAVVDEFEDDIRVLSVEILDKALSSRAVRRHARNCAATADAHAGPHSGHARRRLALAGRKGRCADRQHRSGVHRPTSSIVSTPTHTG